MTTPTGKTDMGWLLDAFSDSVPGVAHAVALSTDGLLIGASRNLPAERADQLSAIVAGLVGLTNGVSTCVEGGPVLQTVVQMSDGFLFLMSVGESSALAALASRSCDLGQVGYEMTMLAERVGAAIDPSPRSEP